MKMLQCYNDPILNVFKHFFHFFCFLSSIILIVFMCARVISFNFYELKLSHLRRRDLCWSATSRRVLKKGFCFQLKYPLNLIYQVVRESCNYKLIVKRRRPIHFHSYFLDTNFNIKFVLKYIWRCPLKQDCPMTYFVY